MSAVAGTTPAGSMTLEETVTCDRMSNGQGFFGGSSLPSLAGAAPQSSPSMPLPHLRVGAGEHWRLLAEAERCGFPNEVERVRKTATAGRRWVGCQGLLISGS